MSLNRLTPAEKERIRAKDRQRQESRERQTEAARPVIEGMLIQGGVMQPKPPEKPEKPAEKPPSLMQAVRDAQRLLDSPGASAEDRDLARKILGRAESNLTDDELEAVEDEENDPWDLELDDERY